MNTICYWLAIFLVAFAVETHSQNENSCDDTGGLVLVNSVIACENERITMQCASATKTIVILTADYGRTEPGTSVCQHQSIRTTSCTSTFASTQVASNHCEGRRTCELFASNSVFGDPCVGTHKYLSVKFICI